MSIFYREISQIRYNCQAVGVLFCFGGGCKHLTRPCNLNGFTQLYHFGAKYAPICAVSRANGVGSITIRVRD